MRPGRTQARGERAHPPLFWLPSAPGPSSSAPPGRCASRALGAYRPAHTGRRLLTAATSMAGNEEEGPPTFPPPSRHSAFGCRCRRLQVARKQTSPTGHTQTPPSVCWRKEVPPPNGDLSSRPPDPPFPDASHTPLPRGGQNFVPRQRASGLPRPPSLASPRSRCVPCVSVCGGCHRIPRPEALGRSELALLSVCQSQPQASGAPPPRPSPGLRLLRAPPQRGHTSPPSRSKAKGDKPREPQTIQAAVPGAASPSASIPVCLPLLGSPAAAGPWPPLFPPPARASRACSASHQRFPSRIAELGIVGWLGGMERGERYWNEGEEGIRMHEWGKRREA